MQTSCQPAWVLSEALGPSSRLGSSPDTKTVCTLHTTRRLAESGDADGMTRLCQHLLDEQVLSALHKQAATTTALQACRHYHSYMKVMSMKHIQVHDALTHRSRSLPLRTISSTLSRWVMRLTPCAYTHTMHTAHSTLTLQAGRHYLWLVGTVFWACRPVQGMLHMCCGFTRQALGKQERHGYSSA